ncbi:hypothetical protein K491DRAFT_552915, partial [Lophiostoma macrostomum CBS 122681]
TTIEDLIEITPEEFEKPSAQAIKDAINAKYSNRVISNIGLCICLWDMLDASEGLIGHGTGLVNVNVEFRMMVFRPFRGEILYARIRSSDENAITLDLDFTSEVHIPSYNLFPGTTFNHAENVFVWNDAESGSELFFDHGEPVLFRVEQEEWIDTQPTVIKKDENGDVIEERDTSWRVIGSMSQAGLGPNLWWGIGPENEGQAAAEGQIEGEG